VFILNSLAVIGWIFVPFYLGSSIGKVAPHTGYIKPVLGLLVVIPVSFITPYVLWRSQFHITSWFDMDVFIKWLFPLGGLTAYCYLLEFIEAFKSDRRDKNEQLLALQKARDTRPRRMGEAYRKAAISNSERSDEADTRPRRMGEAYRRAAISNSERSDGADASVAGKQVNHGHVEERLRILLSHPIILLISFCASVLGIVGFFLQFLLNR
jgi:hypothetical protein